jgi:hypothetical protein
MISLDDAIGRSSDVDELRQIIGGGAVAGARRVASAG